MLVYVKRAKELYKNHKINDIEYVGLVWAGIKYNAETEHVVEKATIAFLELYEQNNIMPIKGASIISRAGFSNYNNHNSHGLWPWLQKNGNADIIKQIKESDETLYSVNDSFFDILQKICLYK